MAFAELGLGEWEFDLQPDEIQSVIRRLDFMMALWSSKGIRLGFDSTSTDPDTDSSVPDVAVQAVYLSLALLISGSFGKQLPPSSLAMQREAYDYVLANFMRIPQVHYPSTMPRGAGNKPLRFGTFNQFYPGEGQTVDVGPDSQLILNP